MGTFLVCLPAEQVIRDAFMTHPNSPLPSPVDTLRPRVDVPTSTFGSSVVSGGAS